MLKLSQSHSIILTTFLIILCPIIFLLVGISTFIGILSIPESLKIFVYSSVAGGGGASVHSVVVFFHYFSYGRVLWRSWSWYYCIRPIIGAFLGLILASIILGLFRTSSDKILGWMSIIFLIGMFADPFFIWMKQTWETLTKQIQDEAELAYNQSIGTPAEEIAYEINREVKEWHISNPIYLEWNIENLYSIFKARVPSENKFIHDKIEDLKNEKDLAKLSNNICFLIGEVPLTINQFAGRDINNIAGDMNVNNVAGNLIITQNSPPEDVLKIIQAIQQKVGELDIDTKDKRKISNHLDNAKVELKDKEPDKKSIEESIKSANGILKEAKATGETLKDIGVMVGKAAKWLGTTAAALGWIL